MKFMLAQTSEILFLLLSVDNWATIRILGNLRNAELVY